MTTAVATSPDRTTTAGRTAATAAVSAPTAEATRVVTLSTLRRGDRARVVMVSSDRSDQVARRLIDLGMEPGRVVEVGRRAPLGDPTVYRVADYSLSLRRRDAALVLVEVNA